MFNTICLDSEHWRYRIHFWEGELKGVIAPKRWRFGLVEKLRNVHSFPLALKKNIYVDDCLSRGFMLLTTTDLPITQVCRATIHHNQRHLDVHSIGGNFCWGQIRQGIECANRYISTKTRDSPDHQVTMMGDFNFPSSIVSWVHTNYGIIANPVPGDTTLKRS